MKLLYPAFFRHKLKAAILFPFLLLVCSIANAQQLKLNYKVMKGDKQIGSMTVNENIAGSLKTIKLESHIATSFVVDIKIDATEQAVFQNGFMTESSIYRKVNDNVKANKKLKAFNNGYIISENNKNDTVRNARINFNLMCLYNAEPLSISKVYSDNYEKFLAVKKEDPHVYRIDIPDGSYNVYYYTNGRCTKVEMHQTLYMVTMVLV